MCVFYKVNISWLEIFNNSMRKGLKTCKSTKHFTHDRTTYNMPFLSSFVEMDVKAVQG